MIWPTRVHVDVFGHHQKKGENLKIPSFIHIFGHHQKPLKEKIYSAALKSSNVCFFEKV